MPGPQGSAEVVRNYIQNPGTALDPESPGHSQVNLQEATKEGHFLWLLKHRAGPAIRLSHQAQESVKEKGVLHCQLLRRTRLSTLLERETYLGSWPGAFPGEDSDRGSPARVILQYQRVSRALCDACCSLLIQRPVYPSLPFHVQNQFPTSLDPKLRKLNQLQKINHMMDSMAKQRHLVG